jgi:hypothetical protein
MPRYSAEQIYGFARRAGFSPDESATMTAIALAESGGNSRSHNPHGEDSRGLWQINALAHQDLAAKYDLYDPLQNAKAAYAVSHSGADVSPWTVTHGGTAARYLRYREDAQAAAVAFGDGAGHGVWTGTPGYGHPLSAGHGGGLVDQTAMPGSTTVAQHNTALDRFLEVARAQIGDQYVFGAETKLDDPNPKAFDCSELTQWAAHQAGGDIPDGATAQYLDLKRRGMLIPVEEGKKTPGALLFSFNREPHPGDTEGSMAAAHVAISLGNGSTVEAQNETTGVDEFKAGNRFQYAALIPGISDGTADPLSTPLPAVQPTPVVNATPAQLGGPDTDGDGLTDAMERRLGLDPLRADTDGDNLSDGYELVTSHTDPHKADTDGDKLNDAFELARGMDPTSADSNGDGHLDGSFATDQVDTDHDGLDDALEKTLGLNDHLADTDGDGFSDGLELHAHSNPLDPHSTPLHPVADPLQPDDHHIAPIA